MMACDVIDLLRTKHTPDVFVSECKMGPQGSHRLDAWVMLRTWSPPTIIGYEVKVSRGDWLRDNKWPVYATVCNLFYVVCANGVARPEEVPEGVGLIWVSKGGKKLITKRKAARKEVEDAVGLRKLMTHVLMSRCRITANMFDTDPWVDPRGAERTAQYRKIVEEAEERKRLARFVHQHIRNRLLDAERRVYEAQSQSPQRVLPIEISQKEREVLERLKQVRDQIDDLLSRHKEEVGP